MIRSNLASRPFYNDRAVRLWLLVGLVLVVVATLFNVQRIIRYSGTNTELASQAAQDEARQAELRASASRLRSTVDIKQIEAASTDARQANDLIDRRTFSWTELFNRFELTLPPDVRISSVRPSLNQARQTVLKIAVVAQNVDDINLFMESLDKTGAFARLTPTQERVNEAGQVESTLDAVYLPDSAAKTPAAAAPAADAATAAPAATTPEPAAPASEPIPRSVPTPTPAPPAAPDRSAP